MPDETRRRAGTDPAMHPALGRTDGSGIACRVIDPEDAAAVLSLLCEGFPDRSAAYWSAALSRLRRRDTPESFPRYGHCLTAEGRMVGVVLLVHSTSPADGGTVRCCVSSWYVEPRYRMYASVLAKVALKRRDCTYINMSAEAHTRPILIAQGYACYARGQFLAVPAFAPRVPGAAVHAAGQGADDLDGQTSRLLRDHAEAGCISLCCTSGGAAWPFVFLKRSVARIPLPCAQLIFCDSVGSFVRLQGPIGRHLARRGLTWVMLDADGPVAGLKGVYLDRRMPKYFKGPNPPRLGDLSYTEAALFGP